MQIAREYFGTEPRLVGTKAWWNFACQASAAERASVGQKFHYDPDDYTSMSVFFYLTDEDVHSGPHVVVRATHRRKKLRHIWSLRRSQTDEEILRAYGTERTIALYGDVGFGFVEDGYCFHKGTQPESRDRLMLQLQYAVRDNGAASEEKHRAWLANAAINVV